MKRLLNTLFVTTQGAYLAKDGDTVAVRIEKETRLRVPIHTLAQIVCFGNVLCSPFLMGFCGKNNVLLSFLTENGRFLARVHGSVSGNVLLRTQQYRNSDNTQKAADIARSVILAKVSNCRTVINRCLRDRPDSSGTAGLQRASSYLSHSLEVLQQALNSFELRKLRRSVLHFALL